MVLMGGVLGSIVCLVVTFYLFCRLLPYFVSRNEERENDPKPAQFTPWIFIRYLRYHTPSSVHSIPLSREEINSTPPSYSLRSTSSFGDLLSRLMRAVCLLTILCLLFSLPIYVLKQLDVRSGDLQYVTHRHMDNWLWTMAFLSGTTPAINFLTMSLVCLLYFTFVMNHFGAEVDLTEEPRQSTLPSPSSALKGVTEGDQYHFLILTVWVIFVLNGVVVGTVNGLYLWSTLLDLASDIRIWIQFCFGLFTFLWSVALRGGLPSEIKESKSGVWLFTCLNVINSVVIPCIATALSSPSCYQVSYPPLESLIFLSSETARPSR